MGKNPKYQFFGLKILNSVMRIRIRDLDNSGTWNRDPGRKKSDPG
jgi:hypothetical protein